MLQFYSSVVHKIHKKIFSVNTDVAFYPYSAKLKCTITCNHEVYGIQVFWGGDISSKPRNEVTL
jgi:hypothetical protein